MPEERFQLGEYWLSQRGNSDVWCITWFDKDTRQTKRVSTGERDPVKAQEALAKHFLNEVELKDEKPQEVPIALILDRWYETKGRFLASQDSAISAVTRWKEFWGAAVLSELAIEKRQKEFFTWYERQTAQNAFGETLAPGTIKRQIDIGRRAIKCAYEAHQITSIPFIPTYSADTVNRERILTPEEMAALMNAASGVEHLWRYLLSAIGSASRPGALLELGPAQVDLKHGLLKLNPPGRKQTKKRRPIIPICSTLLPHFGMWASPDSLVYRPKYGRNKAPVDLANLISFRGKRIRSIRRGFALLKKRAGIDDPLVIPYTIRHTMITWLVMCGVPEFSREVFVGHKKPGSATTARYIHLSPGYLAPCAEAMDKYFELLAPLVHRQIILKAANDPTGPAPICVSVAC